jgi:putative SOS response-associated peptidase YedK
MCGRFALHNHPEVVALQFRLAAVPAFAPRYNIAPTADVLVVRNDGPALVRWGLVPRWAKDPSVGAKMNNARAETVAEKPAFREAYRMRRCLIPASGFFEWKRPYGEGKGRRYPYYLRPANAELLGFAGLWETWGDNLQTCAIITTAANETMQPIHDRMPVIVEPQDYERWLAGEEGLLRPAPAGALLAYPVSAAVNRAANDAPEIIEPAPSGAEELGTSGDLFGD